MTETASVDRSGDTFRGVLLIGMRGAGKTTVGKIAATRLGWEFIDLDDRVLASLGGTSVRDVFAQRGEQAWRAGEASALTSLLASPHARRTLVAVGAGAPDDARSRAILEAARGSGWRIIWLAAGLAAITQRLSASLGDRAALTGLGAIEELARLDERRRPAYTALADQVVDGSADSPDAVAGELVRAASG